jgi:hypothetical protein
VSFVRKKRVHNKEYYQLVENYREDGKHRQRVLAHLGKHPSLDSMIAEVAAKAAKADDRVARLRTVLQTLGEDIKRHYSRLIDGEWRGQVPTQAQLGELRYRVVRQSYGEADYPDSPAGKWGGAPTNYWRYHWYLKTEYGVDNREFDHDMEGYWSLERQVEGTERLEKKLQSRLDELRALQS